MIKKAEVIKQYQVNIYCDECGTRMSREPIVLTTNPPKYCYKCSKCGYETNSFNSYPYTIVEFDEGNAIEIEETIQLHK